MTALAPPPAAGPLLDVRGLGKTFSSGGLFAPRTRVCAARDVSFTLARGEAVALVGESGSGKSTIARLLLRLEPADRGEVRLAGEDVLTARSRRAVLAYRARVQMVFQDPFGSLNPVHTVGHHLERPLVRHARLARGALRERVLELLRTVGLEPSAEFVGRWPHELSGGQRQRVAIARALAVGPDVLLADEPTSMLDVSIRMGVLQLLARLRRERGLSILLITHDLASARWLADRILVLYHGRVVEQGPGDEVIAAPAHPYTRALLAAVAGAGRRPVAAPPAALARADAQAAGCPFAARCPERLEACLRSDPGPRRLGRRLVRCHLHPAGAPAATD